MRFEMWVFGPQGIKQLIGVFGREEGEGCGGVVKLAFRHIAVDDVCGDRRSRELVRSGHKGNVGDVCGVFAVVIVFPCGMITSGAADY